MPEVKAHDAGGDEITMFHHEGINYTNVGQESIVNMRALPIREDDVIVCCYPKSGTHWMWETVRNLVAGRLLDDSTEMVSCMMEQAPHEHINALPSPRVLTTHFRLQCVSPDIIKKGCKVVYIIRNPKDVAVSYYNFKLHQPFYNYQGKWENYLEPYALGKFNHGSWFDHVMAWEEAKKNYTNISTHYFEDLKEKPLDEIKKLDEFLGTRRSEFYLSSLSDFISFSKMSRREQAGRTLSKTYRKGEVGDWKNWFTVAQNEWFDQLYSERMKGLDLNIKFTL